MQADITVSDHSTRPRMRPPSRFVIGQVTIRTWLPSSITTACATICRNPCGIAQPRLWVNDMIPFWRTTGPTGNLEDSVSKYALFDRPRVQLLFDKVADDQCVSTYIADTPKVTHILTDMNSPTPPFLQCTPTFTRRANQYPETWKRKCRRCGSSACMEGAQLASYGV